MVLSPYVDVFPNFSIENIPHQDNQWHTIQVFDDTSIGHMDSDVSVQEILENLTRVFPGIPLLLLVAFPLFGGG